MPCSVFLVESGGVLVDVLWLFLLFLVFLESWYLFSAGMELPTLPSSSSTTGANFVSCLYPPYVRAGRENANTYA
jgi:hypothetical protein